MRKSVWLAVALLAVTLTPVSAASRGRRSQVAHLDSSTFNLNEPGWQNLADEVWERRLPEGAVARHTSGFKGVLWLLDDAERRLAATEARAAQGRGAAELAQLFHERERLRGLAAVLQKSLLRAKYNQNAPGYPSWCNNFTWQLTAGAGIAYGVSANGRSTVYYSGVICNANTYLDNYAITNTGQTRDSQSPWGTSINASSSADRTGTSDLCGRGYSFMILTGIGFVVSLEVDNPDGCF